MDKNQMAIAVFNRIGELAHISDFTADGLKKPDVYALCKQGLIERVKRGYYKLPKKSVPKEETLLSKWMKKSVICMESALFYYGYSDFTPREWTVAVSRSSSRTVKEMRKTVPLKAYYVQSDWLHIGKTTGTFNGVVLPVYDRERTVCDCFKYRTKLDNEIFNKAINAYVSDERKNLSNLAKYAKQLGVYEKMMSVMEVLLNG